MFSRPISPAGPVCACSGRENMAPARSHGGDDTVENLVLLHPNCHRQVHREGLVVEKSASREGRL
jgi:hypothetical protein